jgi:6-phosphofructokinase
VIAGIFDYLAKWCPGSSVFGFLNGPGGVMRGEYLELSAATLVRCRAASDRSVV